MHSVTVCELNTHQYVFWHLVDRQPVISIRKHYKSSLMNEHGLICTNVRCLSNRLLQRIVSTILRFTNLTRFRFSKNTLVDLQKWIMEVQLLKTNFWKTSIVLIRDLTCRWKICCTSMYRHKQSDKLKYVVHSHFKNQYWRFNSRSTFLLFNLFIK